MTKYNFCVFILTHGRPNNVITLRTLKKSLCEYPVYLVIDNEDKTADEYYSRYGKEKVIMFDKKKYADEIDECNNFNERRTITMARNACFDIAKQLGYDYFIELDDDYKSFNYRYVKNSKLRDRAVKNITGIFNLYLDFFTSNLYHTVAFAQGGDFIGGKSNMQAANKTMKRKAMNSFFCSTKQPFKFIGAMNEDVNTYTTLGSRGALFITAPFISLTQKQTQQQAGGITDMYLKYGTYCKAFTTVMNMPSSVKIQIMGDKNPRIHHHIQWKNTVPKIINEKYKQS